MTKGRRIREKRESLRLSQTELANKIGVSKQTLYKYENDIVTNIPSDVIERLSDNLGCSPSYIMGWENKDIIVEFTQKFKQLSQEQQEDVINYMDFIASKRK